MRRLLRQDRWIVAGLLALMTVIALPVLTYPMGRDQGMYANIARAILNGGLPYKDAWDIKPPAIYYLYALDIAAFGRGSAALRAIDLVSVPFTLIGLYWLGKRLINRRAAVLAIVLFTVFYFTETFATLTQSDSVATLPMTLAVVCVVQTGDSPRASRRALLWSAGAGALCAATLWFKQYYALFVIVVVIYHIRVRRGIPYKEALAFALGGLPVGVIPLVYFASNGVLQEMLYVAQGTAAYNAQAFASVPDFIAQMSNYVLFRWWQWGSLIALAALRPFLRGTNNQLSAISYQLSATSPHNSVLSPDLSVLPSSLITHNSLLLFWLLAGLGFVIIQAKGFDTHWMPMLPPLALIAADSLDRLLQIIAARLPARATAPLHAAAALVVIAILLRGMWLPALPYLLGRETLHDYYLNFQANDLKPAESLEVIDYLRQHEPPGDTLFIWGFRPEVYYLADLKPATRFLAHFPLVSPGYPPEWKKEAVDTLWAALPPYVLVLQADYMPWVTGSHEDSHQLLVEYTDLSNWLAYNYVRDSKIGNFLIWRRKS
jgi:4-amino-4-deoxy-L-arabinose transferase-like glycosyltransferase